MDDACSRRSRLYDIRHIFRDCLRCAESRENANGNLPSRALDNFAASAVAGLLYRVVAPRAAFLYLAIWIAVAAGSFVSVRFRARRRSG